MCPIPLSLKLHLPGIGLPFPASELGLSCAGDTIDAQVSCRAWKPGSERLRRQDFISPPPTLTFCLYMVHPGSAGLFR